MDDNDDFQLQQLLCVAFMASALFSNEQAVTRVAFWNDPVMWAEGTLQPADLRTD